jgi:uncharacterized membrane protein
MKKSSALKAQARAAMKGNWGWSILALLVVGAISSIADSITLGLAALVTPVFAFGLASFFMTVARQGSAPFATIFTDTFSGFFKKWLAMFLEGLYICLWSMLFVIPGIVKSYAYAMTYYILLDNPEMSANEAITKSKEMMKGYKWKLFCLDFSFIGWYLLSFLTFGLVLIYAIPLMNAARAQFYEELKAQN